MSTSRKINDIIRKTITYILLTIGAIFCLFPLIWMIITALMTNIEVMTIGVWWPQRLRWENFHAAFTAHPFGQWTRNTATITGITMIGVLFSNTVVAYGFARFKTFGSNFLFMVMMATMMLPGTVTMIPLFLIFNRLEWVNTFLPLIVPHFFGSAFFIFLLRQFFKGIPTELEDAAKIDGVGAFGTLVRIIIPLVLPALTAVAIFHFNGIWNDFMGPLIYLRRRELFTLALGINFFRTETHVQWNYLMAASLFSMLPSVIIFFLGQKYFIEGIAISSGTKG